LTGNAISRNPKVLKVEIDSIWEMALEIVRERSSKIDDTEERMIHPISELSRLDEPGASKILERRGLGME
jgi:hypothetical protein